jgi:hypothetical protein
VLDLFYPALKHWNLSKPNIAAVGKPGHVLARQDKKAAAMLDATGDLFADMDTLSDPGETLDETNQALICLDCKLLMLSNQLLP